MNTLGFDPQNLQHVKLDLPRQQWEASQANRPGKRLYMAAQGFVTPQAQEWVSSPVQAAQPRHLTVKLPVRKLVVAAGLLVGFLITLGMGAMLGSQQPDSQTQATLHYAQSHAPAGQTCGAVWLDGADHWTVECGNISR